MIGQHTHLRENDDLHLWRSLAVKEKQPKKGTKGKTSERKSVQ